MNYFKLFSIPEKFKINQKLLSDNFYKLQLKFHPDLFINHPESKKKLVLEKSIEINKGYKTLKNFFSRAIHLLYLNGFKLNKEKILFKNNHCLITYFKLYEELDEIKKDNFNQNKLNIFLNKIEEQTKNCQKIIEIEFENQNYEKIVDKIGNLLFFKKIKDNLEKEQETYLKQIN